MQARVKALKRHKENRDLKAYAINYYKTNRARFKSKDEAAEEIVQKVIPGTSFRVARRWLNGV
jgi:hypothetical protein